MVVLPFPIKQRNDHLISRLFVNEIFLRWHYTFVFNLKKKAFPIDFAARTASIIIYLNQPLQSVESICESLFTSVTSDLFTNRLSASLRSGPTVIKLEKIKNFALQFSLISKNISKLKIHVYYPYKAFRISSMIRK